MIYAAADFILRPLVLAFLLLTAAALGLAWHGTFSRQLDAAHKRRTLDFDEDETATAVMAAPVAPVFPTWTPGIGREPRSGTGATTVINHNGSTSDLDSRGGWEDVPAVPSALTSLWPHAAAVVTVTDSPGRHAQPRAYPVTPPRPLHPAIAASLAAAGYTPHATAEDLLNSVYTKADAAMVRAITS